MAPAHTQFEGKVVRLVNADGASSVVLACEHATPFVPDCFANLGLKPEDRHSHAAWDPGALAVAARLSKHLDAKLVASEISRLVYDCNRPPEAADAMPERSERVVVPGNIGLNQHQRNVRVQHYYEPFREALASAMGTTKAPILVTVHSFTPVYDGRHRSVEIGILHDSDTRLADAMLDVAADSGLDVRRNEPYGPQDGVTHTLKEHAIEAGHPNVMIEIRNDLIADETGQTRIADLLGTWLETALPRVIQRGPEQEGSLACAG
jgi:predicted N-formylglutamate amidohydrolase